MLPEQQYVSEWLGMLSAENCITNLELAHNKQKTVASEPPSVGRSDTSQYLSTCRSYGKKTVTDKKEFQRYAIHFFRIF